MLRVISDIHGYMDRYLEIIADCDDSIQLGDLAFDYSLLANVDFNSHLFLPGNHDNHDDKYNWNHCLRRYGLENHGDIDFFYLEGAFSIDYKYRLEKELSQEWPKTWWENEELTQEELEDSVNFYKNIKPDIVLTHEAPRTIADIIGSSDVLRNFGFDPTTFSTRTSDALDRMYKAHAPKLWIFGHYHKAFDMIINGCRFICQRELEYLDLDSDLSIVKYSA